MKEIKGKRMLAWILSVAIFTTQLGGVQVYGQTSITQENPCINHKEHTVECEYKKEAECLHIHNDNCEYKKAVEGEVCNFVTEEKEDVITSHNHDDNCGYKEAVEGVDCKHSHDDNCGYAVGTICIHQCELCTIIVQEDKIMNITGFDELAQVVKEQLVEAGTKQEDLNLPTTLLATGYMAVKDTTGENNLTDVSTPQSTSLIIEDVKWELTAENNDGNTQYDDEGEQGSYIFSPILPEGINIIGEDIIAPQIYVMVGHLQMMRASYNNIGDWFVTIDDDDQCNGHVITGKTTMFQIVVHGGTHNITLKDVSIILTNGTANNNPGTGAFVLEGNSQVNLTIEGTNNIQSGWGHAGIQVENRNGFESTLNIQGSGTLNVTGGADSAGIGGSGIVRYGNGGDGSIITINSGTVNATGGFWGAGIGGGIRAAGGTTTINGGTVTAKGLKGGAGIGGGTDGAYNPGVLGGIVNITGGTVIATCDDADASGIGGGREYDGDSKLTITGDNTVVIATSISKESEKDN